MTIKSSDILTVTDPKSCIPTMNFTIVLDSFVLVILGGRMTIWMIQHALIKATENAVITCYLSLIRLSHGANMTERLLQDLAQHCEPMNCSMDKKVYVDYLFTVTLTTSSSLIISVG